MTRTIPLTPELQNWLDGLVLTILLPPGPNIDSATQQRLSVALLNAMRTRFPSTALTAVMALWFAYRKMRIPACGQLDSLDWAEMHRRFLEYFRHQVAS